MFYIFALAAGLRLILINQSLWLDEAIQAQALSGQLGPLLKYALFDFQPPLYHLLLLGWTHLFGFSELALRLPSLLSGLGTVYFVIKIGQLLGKERLGIIAGLLSSTNPLLIYYSQEGRTYALTCFLVSASFYYLLAHLKKPSSSTMIRYSFFIILTLWTSYLAWFVILGQGIYWLVKRNYKMLGVTLACTMTLLIWLPSLLSSLSIGLSDARSMPGWGRVVGGISLKSLVLTWVKLNIGRISFENHYLYATIISFVGLLHLYIFSFLRFKKYTPLFIWLFAPLVLASLFSLFIPVYSYTRMLFVVPAYLLLLAIGLSKLHHNFTYLTLTLQLIFVAIFWLSPRFHREDWRTLTKDLNAQPNIQVALPSLRSSAPLLYYGLTHSLIELRALDQISPRVYYIRYGEEIFDPGLLGQAKLLSSGYTITKEKTYPGIQLDIYENRN